MSGIEKIQQELSSALDWLNTLEKLLLDSLREKSPQRTIELTRGVWRKIYEKAGRPADAGEAREPREYSLVSVNAMLLEMSRRGLVKRTRDLEWELAAVDSAQVKVVTTRITNSMAIACRSDRRGAPACFVTT